MKVLDTVKEVIGTVETPTNENWTEKEADAVKFTVAWLAALRSGKLAQQRATLGNVVDGRFCCLGAACVVDAAQNDRELHTYRGGALVTCVGRDASVSDLKGSPTIRYFYSQFGAVFEDTLGLSLAMLNDSEMCTFEEIANIVERDPSDYMANWPKGFRLKAK